MDRLVLLPKLLAQCDTLTCSTSTLTAPPDLTPPLFAVHLCTSHICVGHLWSFNNVCIFLGELLQRVCTWSRQRATGLIRASLKLVNMLPFPPCRANQHMGHSRTLPPSVIQCTGFSRLKHTHTHTIDILIDDLPPVQLMRLITTLFRAEIREHYKRRAALMTWLTRNDQVIMAFCYVY